MDASNLLKPMLARGELHCIGATTLDEYRKHIEKDAALERRFQPVMVDQPTVEDTISILRGLQGALRGPPRRADQGRRAGGGGGAVAPLHHRPVPARQGHRPRGRGGGAAADGDRLDAGRAGRDHPADHAARDRARAPCSKETDAASRDRLAKLEKELADLQAQATTLREQWEREKAAIERPRQLRKRIEEVKLEIDKAMRAYDLNRVAELQYGTLAQLERELKELEAQAEAGGGRRLIKEEVDEEDIAEVVSRWTGIPVSKLMEGEMQKLLRLEEELHHRVVGQDEAVRAVADAVIRARAGIKDPKRPIGSFLFLGPTGVGKTELARALAATLFDDEDNIVRLDMSEYMEKHTVARLIGAPPGYVGYEEGGQLTEAVRRKPYSVVLLDEIEKAHPDVFNVLLQVLDDGRLTDGQGRTVSFKNTVIIMTSNIGSQLILEMRGADERSYQQMREQVLDALRRQFRPEFLNRVDEVVVFRALTEAELARIVEIQLEGLRQRLAERRITLEVTEAAGAWLARVGYDPVFGARPLKRAIQREVETPVARLIVAGKVRDGDTVRVDVAGDALRVEAWPGHRAKRCRHERVRGRAAAGAVVALCVPGCRPARSASPCGSSSWRRWSAGRSAPARSARAWRRPCGRPAAWSRSSARPKSWSRPSAAQRSRRCEDTVGTAPAGLTRRWAPPTPCSTSSLGEHWGARGAGVALARSSRTATAGGRTTAELTCDLAVLAKNWWIVALRGVAAILFGILTAIVPGLSLAALVMLFGAYALIEGGFNIIPQSAAGGAAAWWALLLEGLVSVAAGDIAFVMPGLTALALVYVIAAWAVLTGVLEIAAAVRLRKHIGGSGGSRWPACCRAPSVSSCHSIRAPGPWSWSSGSAPTRSFSASCSSRSGSSSAACGSSCPTRSCCTHRGARHAAMADVVLRAEGPALFWVAIIAAVWVLQHRRPGRAGGGRSSAPGGRSWRRRSSRAARQPDGGGEGRDAGGGQHRLGQDGAGPERMPGPFLSIRSSASSPVRSRRRSASGASGSGVIVTRDGLHPHQQPRRRGSRRTIKVTLNDGRELKAKLIGTDPEDRPRGAEAAGAGLPGRCRSATRPGRGRRVRAGDRQSVRPRPDRDDGHRQRARAAPTWASPTTRTSSRPTRRSTPATRAARW